MSESIRKRLHEIYQQQINRGAWGYGLIGGRVKKGSVKSHHSRRSSRSHVSGGSRIGGALREQHMIERRLNQIEHILGLENRVSADERHYYKGALTRIKNANKKALSHEQKIYDTKPRRKRTKKAPSMKKIKGITVDLLMQGITPSEVAEDLIEEGVTPAKAVKAVEKSAIELQEISPEILQQIEEGDLSGIGLIGGRAMGGRMRHRRASSVKSHRSHRSHMSGSAMHMMKSKSKSRSRSRSHKSMRGHAMRPAKGSAEAKRRMAMVRAHKRS